MTQLAQAHSTKPFVLLVYKSFANDPQVSHSGLGISAKAASMVLAEHGLHGQPLPVFDGYEFEKKLREIQKGPLTVTHVIFYAPFIDMGFMEGLVKRWPKVHFTVTIHSNIAFLQTDSFSVKIIREGTGVSKRNKNFVISANSTMLVEFIREVYKAPCAWLPNLYPTGKKSPRPCEEILRLGLFGAIRPLKNILSGVAAAILLSKSRPAELFLSGGRIEGGEGIMRAVNELVTGQENLKLTVTPWYGWEDFRKFVSTMHLLLQPSFSETFNNVTADGAAQQVPSVISPAINWAPNYWRVNPENVFEIEDKAKELLDCPHAGMDGFHALEKHNLTGLVAWVQFLHP